jgi:hypothetical protein
VNIYLDIDGVLVARGRKPAKHLKEFLKQCTDSYPTYWLTTHCKGDPLTAIQYLSDILDTQSIELAKRIKPTTWSYSKTDGIDFTAPFLWFDDYLFEYEKEQLRKHDCYGSWIRVDLQNNLDQLKDITNLLIHSEKAYK